MSRIDRALLCFDMILVRKAGDHYNAITVEAFAALPVDERIRLIMEKRVRFLAEEVDVPVYQAIKSLDAARG